jgi:hypothetical protein
MALCSVTEETSEYALFEVVMKPHQEKSEQ